MSDTLAVQVGPHGLRISGELGFATSATALRVAHDRVVNAGEENADLAVDVSGLAPADSATLAILLAWAAQAQRNRRSLRYLRMPDGLQALATLADAGALLDPARVT